MTTLKYVIKYITQHGNKNGNNMARVALRQYESFDSLLKRFKKLVDRDGILKEYMSREHFVSNSELKKRNKAAARKRLHKQIQDEQNQLSLARQHKI